MDFVEKPLLHPKYIQNAFWFLNLKTTKEFFELLQVNPFVLEYHINQPIYYAIRLPKKKGGERLIQAPNEELKLIQKKLNYYFQAIPLLHYLQK
jgi:RNA-directed DNA polymerase